MNVVDGDLIQMGVAGNFDVIVHGCNCFGVMGAGLAAVIAREFPEVYDADQERMTQASDARLHSPGSFTSALIESRPTASALVVMNWYTQVRPGKNFRLVYLENVLVTLQDDEELQEYAKSLGRPVRVGVPMIGCGVGGGCLEDVQAAFDKAALEMPYVEFTLVNFKPQAKK